MESAFDGEVRRVVYQRAMDDGLPPAASEVAAALSRTVEEVKESFQRLARAHVLVLQGGSGEVLMAAPFSAVPTPFLVESSGRVYYGNCVWDALGIPVVLGRDARVRASCGCCGSLMEMSVEGGALKEAAGVIHFALPAARWWQNIVFT